ncbi:Alpha-1,3-mannosyltransferase-like protein [Cryptotrichosporon argae]
MRIGFIHPDLGIGGAERLVVDAAVALQKRGHEVAIFTSRHDPERCFEETSDGTLQVNVLGSFLPRSLHPRVPLTILFSILRSLALSILLCLSLLLPGPPSFYAPLAGLQKFDALVVDQQSVCVPVLRWLGGTRVVFYCHFPDKLLSGGWEIKDEATDGENRVKLRGKGRGALRSLYRLPVDKLEEFTTGQADIILANSRFSSRVYARAFPSLAERPPRVVYPCIDVDAYKGSRKRKHRAKEGDGVDLVVSDRPTLLSLNRFEEKKNVALAIRAFAKLKELLPERQFADLRLVIAGGYDPQHADNLSTLSSLQSLATSLDLSHHTLTSPTSPAAPPTQILFVLNFTTTQRTALLLAPSTRALLYTPANEHFGIVPIEAAACGVPVLAADSGGPTETVIDLALSNAQPTNDDGTGVLCPPRPALWAEAIAALLSLTDGRRATLAAAAKRRVDDRFSLDILGREMEAACAEVAAMRSYHDELGDRLIYAGAGLMALGAAGIAVLLYAYQ